MLVSGDVVFSSPLPMPEPSVMLVEGNEEETGPLALPDGRTDEEEGMED